MNNDRGVSGRGRNKLSKYQPLHIEMGRYEGLPEAKRTCIFCKDHIEDEKHALCDCHLYNEIRLELFPYVLNVNNHFNSLTKLDKLVFLFSSPKMVRACAKA